MQATVNLWRSEEFSDTNNEQPDGAAIKMLRCFFTCLLYLILYNKKNISGQTQICLVSL